MDKKKYLNRLQSLIKFAHTLDKNWEEGETKKNVVETMLSFLEDVPRESSFFYAKGISKKISNTMTQEEFRIFLVPFERELARLLHEEDFCVDHLDSKVQEEVSHGIYFVLDNIRSAYNVGSMLRLAECVGAKVILSGYTPREDHPKVKKTSMGCEDFLTILHFKKTLDAIAFLKEKGVSILALETEEKAKNLYDFSLQGKNIALIVGNERHGLSLDLLKECNSLVRIPVWGVKNSLNVTSALSVVAYELRRKLQGKSKNKKGLLPSVIESHEGSGSCF